MGLMHVQEAFGQQPNPLSFIPIPFYSPTNIASEKGSFWWLYPAGNGSKVTDVAGVFAAGAGGYLYDFPTSGLQYNPGFRLRYPELNSFSKPLNYRKILHQEQFGARQSELLVQTDGDVYLLNTNSRLTNPLYDRVSIIPDSLKGLKAAAFISFNSGVIINRNNVVYRTLNSGQSWERKGVAPSGGIRSFTITSGEDLYISYFSGALQYSSDGGTTFRISANNNEVFSNISFYNDNFALATSSFRFYSSNDRGASWSELTTVPRGRPNFIETVTDSIWLVSVDSSVYRTDNAGQTFTALTTPCPVGRISKFTLTRGEFSDNLVGVIVNGNVLEYNSTTGWVSSGFRFSERYSNGFRIDNVGDNEEVKQLFVSDSLSVTLNVVINPIYFLTNTNSIIRSGVEFQAYRTNDNFVKFWAENSSGSIYLGLLDNKIYSDINFPGTSTLAAYPTVTKLLYKNGRVYFIKPGTNYFYSLPVNNLRATVDSVPLATQGNIIDMDAYNNPNTFEIYFLGSDGKVLEFNIGTRLTRIINFPYPVEPLKLKLSKLLVGTPSYIGATDNRGRIFAAEAFSNTLSELNGSLVTSFRDFNIAGDSLFALNTDNVFYVTNIRNPASVVWQKDSIDISRTLTQVHIGYYSPTDTAVGRRPGRIAASRITNYENNLPTVLLTGTGPCMISTNPRDWHNLRLSSKNKNVITPLVLYPNPTKSRSFKISVENPE